MLEKPDLQDDQIITCLRDGYGLTIARVVFLPLGADSNTAVYRVVTDEETPYFLKLRGGVFDETSVALLGYLSDQGIEQIIPPLRTRAGQLWANLDAFKVILYPFVEGHNGYENRLADHHWGAFGGALKRIHTIEVPPALLANIRQETFDSQAREIVKAFVERAEIEVFGDPVTAGVAVILRTKRAEILDLVERAERLAQALQGQTPEFVVCHSDIHAGNILVGVDGAFYIVDWDAPILAPKERDLMSIGGGLMSSGHTPQEEEALFYRAYGQPQIDLRALAYYRYERIVQDIAAFCEQLLLTDEGGEDREQSLRYLASNFIPNGTIEIAYRSDRTVRAAIHHLPNPINKQKEPYI